jgi:insertion element IS1 protein InsB
VALSYQTGQVLSFAAGPRDLETGRKLMEGIPKEYRRKQFYTDGLVIYESLIPFHQHWVCEKGSGGTNVIEGCNNYLRHRVSYLVRKSMSFARSIVWFWRRLRFVLHRRNERIKAAWDKKHQQR